MCACGVWCAHGPGHEPVGVPGLCGIDPRSRTNRRKADRTDGDTLEVPDMKQLQSP